VQLLDAERRALDAAGEVRAQREESERASLRLQLQRALQSAAAPPPPPPPLPPMPPPPPRAASPQAQRVGDRRRALGLPPAAPPPRAGAAPPWRGARFGAWRAGDWAAARGRGGGRRVAPFK
jgi:hypothetical protein